MGEKPSATGLTRGWPVVWARQGRPAWDGRSWSQEAHAVPRAGAILPLHCTRLATTSATMQVVVLCSGGMDSVTALYWAGRQHDLSAVVSFDYGAKHNARELPFAAEHAAALGARHEIIRLPFVDALFRSDLLASGGEIPDGHYTAATMKQTVVPFRNAIMLSIVAGFAESVGAQGVVIAAHGGDHAIYPDCREEFMQAMGEAMRCGTDAHIELLRPFIAMTKGQIAREGARLGVAFGRTWSCYRGGEVHCGRCGTCVERREAFAEAGLSDPTVYEGTPSLERELGSPPRE